MANTQSSSSGDQAHLGAFRYTDVLDQLAQSSRRFAEQIDDITDERATGRNTPTWPVGDIVRHVTFLPGYYTSIVEHSAHLIDAAAQMSEVNDTNLSTMNALSMAQCKERLVDDIRRFIDKMSGIDPFEVIPFQAGSSATAAELVGIAVGEYEVHGLDVATSIGRSWDIPDRAAAMTILAAIPAAGAAWMDTQQAAGHSGTYEVRLRGGFGSVDLDFDDGALTARARHGDPAASTRQTIASVKPSAMLEVFYARRSQWSAMARGQMLSWGTRPLRALSLRRKFLPI